MPVSPDAWQEIAEAVAVISRGAATSRVTTRRYEVHRVDGAVVITIPDLPTEGAAVAVADAPSVPSAMPEPGANGGSRTRPRVGTPSA